MAAAAAFLLRKPAGTAGAPAASAHFETGLFLHPSMPLQRPRRQKRGAAECVERGALRIGEREALRHSHAGRVRRSQGRPGNRAEARAETYLLVLELLIADSAGTRGIQPPERVRICRAFRPGTLPPFSPKGSKYNGSAGRYGKTREEVSRSQNTEVDANHPEG